MSSSTFDLPALLVAVALSIVIAGTLILAHRGGDTRRGWIAAGILTLALSAVGVIDLLRESPRETHASAIVSGLMIAVLGSVGMVRGTRRVQPWIRWPLVTVVAFALLLGGLLMGAAYISHLLPF